MVGVPCPGDWLAPVVVGAGGIGQFPDRTERAPVDGPAGDDAELSSAHSASGMGVFRYEASAVISSGERAPTTADVTAGWRRVNCSAAAASGTPWAAQASRIRRARASSAG